MNSQLTPGRSFPQFPLKADRPSNTRETVNMVATRGLRKQTFLWRGSRR